MRFLWLAVLLVAWAGSVVADTRGINVRVKDTGGTTVALYAESHALVVGVSEYTNGWPRLRGVGKDVPAVKTALEKQGFQVTVVTDPDRDGLDKAFRNFIELHGLKPNNRLLFYFAGHGHSAKLGYGGTMGYLVGRDAPNPNIDRSGFRRNALSMQVIETYARNIESKHALFLFDACFAGSVFDATRAIPEVIRAKTGKPVRQFITSGTAEQQVPDRSVFRRQFVAALGGEGDLDGDGYVTGAELGQFLETTVTNYTRRSQTPQYGKLRDPLLDKGDFVFVLPEAAEQRSPYQGVRRQAEIVVWQSIKDGTSPAMFEEFLRQFPDGQFAAFARVRLKELKGGQVAALPPQSSAPSGDQVGEAQRLLAALGYTPGPADGRIGTNTRRAIARFQRSSGQDADGTVSDGLLANLREAQRLAAEAERKGNEEEAQRRVATVVPPPQAPPTQPAVTQPPPPLPATPTPGSVWKEPFTGMEFVRIPKGCFRMGPVAERGTTSSRQLLSEEEFAKLPWLLKAPLYVAAALLPVGCASPKRTSKEYDSGELPIHEVCVSGFWVGKHEVTQAEWQAVMVSNPSRFKGSRNPVENVSWNDAKEFVRKLSTKAGKKYRLLSEAEWEYMARAGSSTKWSCGNNDGCLDRVAWYYRNSGTKVHPVGGKSPNRFGVHDTHGNVWEWVEDCWHNNYDGVPTDGSAWTSGGNCGRRILRGGSWGNGSWFVRSAIRGGDGTNDGNNTYGFRVARTF